MCTWQGQWLWRNWVSSTGWRGMTCARWSARWSAKSNSAATGSIGLGWPRLRHRWPHLWPGRRWSWYLASIVKIQVDALVAGIWQVASADELIERLQFWFVRAKVGDSESGLDNSRRVEIELLLHHAEQESLWPIEITVWCCYLQDHVHRLKLLSVTSTSDCWHLRINSASVTRSSLCCRLSNICEWTLARLPIIVRHIRILK